MTIKGSLYPSIASSLAKDGYIVLTNFLPSQIIQQLYDHVIALPNESFQQARVGSKNNLQLNKKVRNDKSLWLCEQHPIEKNYLAIMEECRIQLNKRLFLGLQRFEAHFSYYKTGAFYQRHIDSFQDQSHRIISSVFYLNPDWSDDNGGELILYEPDSDNILSIIRPHFGTMVLFLSEEFSHEVLPTKYDRYSIAGWFHSDNITD